MAKQSIDLNGKKRALTVIVIIAGVIELIEDDGNIAYYRQRGIDQIPLEIKEFLISKGMLNRYWKSYPEIPKNAYIRYADPSTMGRALKTYPIRDLMDYFRMRHSKKKK